MLDFFQYDFLTRAFLAGLMLSIIAPLMGMFLVVRRYSLLADTLAHISLLGVAIGLFFGVAPLLTSTLAAAAAGVGMERLREDRKLFGESILALFLSGSLALAVVLMSLTPGLNANLLSYLFGSITTVTPVDLFVIGCVSLVIILFVVIFYRQLFLLSLDDDLARVAGIRARALNMILITLSAVTVALSVGIVGALLIGALLVIPVLSAIQFGLGFLRTLLLGVAFSVVSVVAGLFLSYHFDLPSGGTIVLVALFFFVLSFIVNKIRS